VPLEQPISIRQYTRAVRWFGVPLLGYGIRPQIVSRVPSMASAMDPNREIATESAVGH
jgi:hypothetical protein